MVRVLLSNCSLSPGIYSIPVKDKYALYLLKETMNISLQIPAPALI